MRWNDIHIAGLGTWLPQPRTVQSMMDLGLCGDTPPDAYGYESVLVAGTGPEDAPPEMAIRAAATAMKRAGVDAGDYALHLHGSTWFQGLDIWPAASYIAERTVGSSVRAFDIQQRCNIGVSGIEMAATFLRAGFPGSAAMLTTADRFDSPGVDRWNLRPGTVYGDGATALVLSATGGFATLRSTVTTADNFLEGRARGDEQFTTGSRAATHPVRLADREKTFNDASDESELMLRLARVMFGAMWGALEEAEIEIADVAYVALPSVGRSLSGYLLYDLLSVTEDRTTLPYGLRTGHIGAGDWIAGLDHLLESRSLQAGDHVLLMGGGAGYTQTAAVVRIDEVPEWC